MAAAEQPIRVLRVIARLNVGGPAYHVCLLSGRMPARYQTLLVSGRVAATEGSFDDLAVRYGANHRVLDSLGPEPRPLADLRTIVTLARLVREFDPDIVHTHTAKAGLVGRVAARLAAGRRPILIHTYHGHVLTGYFGRLQTALYRTLERLTGTVTTRLVAVSQAVADDLVRLRIAPASKFDVIPLGLDLEAFQRVRREDGQSFRDELGLTSEHVLLVAIGRLVAIKRLDLLLDAVAHLGEGSVPVVLAVIGDGELRPELERQAAELGIADRVRFMGFRTDLAAIQAAADVAVLTSDNEGTPVALIEAAAAGTPAVATDVGGVRDVVRPETGRVVPCGSANRERLVAALTELIESAPLRAQLGEAARKHVRDRYSSERLLADIDALYTRELGRRRERNR